MSDLIIKKIFFFVPACYQRLMTFILGYIKFKEAIIELLFGK